MSHVHSPGRGSLAAPSATAETWKETMLGPDRTGFQPPTLIYTDVRYSVSQQLFRRTRFQVSLIIVSRFGEFWGRCCGSYRWLEASSRGPPGICGTHTTDLLLDQDWLQLHTTMGRAEVAEAQLLRCSCRFTRGQSELSVIIIALRRKRVQGCAHLTMSAASILSRRSCRKRRTTLDNSHHGAATRRNFVWSGLWWQTAMGQ